MIANLPRVTAYVVAAILAALVCAPASGVAAAQLPIAGPSVVGYWQGRLNIPGGGGLTIGLNIRAELNGSLAATLDSPDQGAMGIPASAVSVAGGIVRVEVSSIGGAFEGALSSAGTEIVGTWRGESICIDRKVAPACTDEVVVFEFRRSPKPGTVSLQADKIVNGERRKMGELEFAWDAGEGCWRSEFETPRTHGYWCLVVDGREVTGTLRTLPERAQVRRLSVRRD